MAHEFFVIFLEALKRQNFHYSYYFIQNHKKKLAKMNFHN